MIEEIEQARDRAAGRLIERPGGDRAGGRRSSGLDMMVEIERPGGDRAAGRRSSGLNTIEEIERPGGDRAGGRRSSGLNMIEEIERPGGDRAGGRRSSGLNTIEEIERPGGDRAGGRRSSGLDTIEEIERPGGDRAAGRRSSGLNTIEEIERPGGDRAGGRRSSGLNTIEEIERPGGDRAGGRRSSGLDTIEEIERPGGDRAGGRRSSGLDTIEEIERPGGDRAGGRRSSGLDTIEEIERPGGDRAGGRRSSGLEMIEEIERPGGDRAGGRRSSGLDMIEEIGWPGGDRAGGRRSSGLDMIEEIERPGGDRAGGRRSSGLDMTEEIERPGGDRVGGRRSSDLEMIEEIERLGRQGEGRSERGRRFREMKMEAVVATEEWIRNKAQLNNVRADEVESLSLQGTYNDKIVALGDALLNFKRLRSLDLSRNSIVNLGGLECLHSLEKLNLYYNNVPALKEISSLRHLINLKELDLRLNPITRNEQNYRQCIIRLLPNLKRLDDRPIRDSERKNAQMYFNSQEQNGTSELDKTEESDHIKKNFMHDKDEQDSMSPTMKYKWDAASNIKTDLKERWASRDFQLMNDRQESACSRPPLSAHYSARDVRETRENDVSSKMSLDPMEMEHLRSGQYHSYLGEDDYRTYQSPVRSSLRSAGKNVCNRSREGFRVTFSDKILDSCTNEQSCQKNSINSEYDHSSGYSKKGRNLMDYTDTSVMKDTSTSIESNSMLSRDYHKQLYTDTKSYQSTLESQSSYLNHQTDKATTGMNSDRLFKLNSDLKTSSTYGSSKNTHVDDSTSNHRSRMPSIGLIPHHGTSSSDHIVDRQSLISPSSSFTSLYSVGSKRGFTEHVNMELMANKSSERQSQLTTANMEHFESKLEPKKTSSLSSELYMQPSYDRKQSTLDKLLEADECGDYHSRTPVGLSSGVSANVTSTLQNFLDLVDRHWNGSRSLHTNQRFLNSAHELLSNMMNSMSISKIQSLEKKVKAGSGLDTAELHRLKHQLTQKQDDLESLKGRFAKVLDENNKLRSQLTSLELANCAGNQLQNKNLQKEYDRLNLEVEYLRQQVKQYNKLQDTVSLLQESHRALISTNNYLQEQLNIRPAGQKSDMSHHLGPHRTKVWSKLSASGMSELSLSSKSSHHSNIDIL